ncbi:hypothetical protein LCGC14_2878370 [marine sediment metagenome]|uniref:Right handed beta helix domain-containing protein n=1 Tax=marine sediment metagenome TaxID=412755 RepID=A0A0F9AS10_9ZZZZ
MTATSSVRRGWHFNQQTQRLEAYNNGNEIFQYPFGTNYYVDSINGSATATGLSWATAFSTISLAMTAAAALGASAVRRGGVSIYVAPGGYTEDIVTPLNAVCPFGELVAVNPTPGRSFGAAWLSPSTADTPILTVQARGWRISGFEFDPNSGGAVVIGGATAGNNGAGTLIENCLFNGGGVALFGIDFQSDIAGNPLCTIRHNTFYDFNPGTTAACIKCSASGIDQPTLAIVEDNLFEGSDNYIDMNPRGFKSSIIRGNTFLAATADEKFDNTGGSNCQVYGNAMGGAYTLVGGYVAGSGDDWSGNMAEAVTGESANGWTFAIPAS